MEWQNCSSGGEYINSQANMYTNIFCLSPLGLIPPSTSLFPFLSGLFLILGVLLTTPLTEATRHKLFTEGNSHYVTGEVMTAKPAMIGHCLRRGCPDTKMASTVYYTVCLLIAAIFPVYIFLPCFTLHSPATSISASITFSLRTKGTEFSPVQQIRQNHSVEHGIVLINTVKLLKLACNSQQLMLGSIQTWWEKSQLIISVD